MTWLLQNFGSEIEQFYVFSLIFLQFKSLRSSLDDHATSHQSLERQLIDIRAGHIRQAMELEAAVQSWRTTREQLEQTEPDYISKHLPQTALISSLPSSPSHAADAMAVKGGTAARGSTQRSTIGSGAEAQVLPRILPNADSPTASGSFLTKDFQIDMSYFNSDSKASADLIASPRDTGQMTSPRQFVDPPVSPFPASSPRESPQRSGGQSSATSPGQDAALSRRQSLPQQQAIAESNARIERLRLEIDRHAQTVFASLSPRSNSNVRHPWLELFSSVLHVNCAMRLKGNSYTELIDHLAAEKLARFERDFEAAAARAAAEAANTANATSKKGKGQKDKRRKSRSDAPVAVLPPGLSTQSVLLQAKPLPLPN